MKKGGLVFVYILFSVFLYAATVTDDSLYLQKRIHLLQTITQLQDKTDTGVLLGSFPSTRKYYFNPTHKQEDNVFFTALILYNIGQFSQHMLPEELAMIEQAKTNALVYINRFKNQKNQLTYNFWPRNPPQIFPNGGWLNHFNQQFALADDIDDGAITLLAIGVNDSIAKAMQTKFGMYRVGMMKPNRSFYQQYKSKPVYSTWLGHKMPKDVDLSVLTNVLLMHTMAKIPFNATDTASLDLMIHLIKDNKHLNDARYVSQHYAHPATILYHIARLIHASNYAPLLELKPILLEQALALSKQATYPLEKLLLNTSILRLGGEIDFPLEINEASLRTNNYPYFVANIASVLNNPFKRIVNQSNIVRFDYYSYAFNLSLMYENWMLRSGTQKPF